METAASLQKNGEDDNQDGGGYHHVFRQNNIVIQRLNLQMSSAYYQFEQPLLFSSTLQRPWYHCKSSILTMSCV